MHVTCVAAGADHCAQSAARSMPGGVLTRGAAPSALRWRSNDGAGRVAARPTPYNALFGASAPVECIVSLTLSWGHRLARRRFFLCAALCGLPLASLLCASSISAHPAPHPFLMAPEVLTWVQPDGANDWDMYFQTFDGRSGQRAVQPRQMSICWEEDLYDELVDLPGQAAVVWLRSREDGVTSTWVGPRLVSVPEPGSGVAMLVGTVALAHAQRRRARAERAPAAPGAPRPSPQSRVRRGRGGASVSEARPD